MKKWMAALAVTGMAFFGSGCGNQGDSSGAAKTVVVDLQMLAKALNRDQLIQQLINQNNQNLISQLKAAETTINDQWEVERSKAGDLNKADDKTKQELQVKLLDLQNRLRGAAGQADQISRNFQLQLLMNFRDEVRPFAQKVANRRGASLVMITAEPILSYDPSVDITTDVISEMRPLQPGLQVPPMAPPAQQGAAAPSGTNAAPAPAAPAATGTTAAPKAAAPAAPAPKTDTKK